MGYEVCNDRMHNDHQSGYPIDANAFQTQLGGAPAYKCLCQYPRDDKSIQVFDNDYKREEVDWSALRGTLIRTRLHT